MRLTKIAILASLVPLLAMGGQSVNTGNHRKIFTSGLLTVSDTFNYSNPSCALSTSWTVNIGTIATVPCAGGPAVIGYAGNAAGQSLAFWNADTFTADQYSQITFTAIGAAGGRQMGAAVRVQGSGSNAYVCGEDGGGTVTFLGSYAGGTFSPLAAFGSSTINPGDVLRLEVTGTGASTALVCKLNGSTILSATDATGTFATGQPGIDASGVTFGGDGIASPWQAGEI